MMIVPKGKEIALLLVLRETLEVESEEAMVIEVAEAIGSLWKAYQRAHAAPPDLLDPALVDLTL